MRTPSSSSHTPLAPETLAAFEIALGASAQPTTGNRRRRAFRSIGLGCTFALVGGTALAATGAWRPFGNAPDARYTLAQAPATQTGVLSVLRRPQNVLDQGALMTAFLQRYPKGTPGRVYLRYVRALRPVTTAAAIGPGGRIGTKPGKALLVLIPNEEGSVEFGSGAARRIDAGSLCLYIIQDQWSSDNTRPLYETGTTTPPNDLKDRVSGAGTCTSPDRLKTRGLQLGAYGGGVLSGVVPDGVAAVRGTTRAGQVVTARVANNSFQLLAPGRDSGPDTAANGASRPDLPSLSGQFKHQSVEWLDAQGNVLRHLPE